MSRPETPTTRRRWDARRADVIERAAHVFARQGYDQTSVPELAEALGQATGGIYHYFSGKEQLLIAICDQLMEPLLAEAEELTVSDAPATEQLRDLVRRWVANVVDHQDHMLVFQQERHLIDHGAQWREVRESRKRFERLVEDVLARARSEVDVPAGARAGVDGAPVDPRLQLSALLGMVNHTAQWYRPRGRLTPAEIADGYVDLVLGC